MKTIASTLIIALSTTLTMAQETAVKKELFITDQVTKERIKIETGQKVAVWFRKPNVRRTGLVLSLSDSAMVLKAGDVPMFVPFQTIASISVISQIRRRMMARVDFRSGQKLTGELVLVGKDSIALRLTKTQLIPLKASEIRYMQIRARGYTGKCIAIGAIAGASVGAIVGGATDAHNSNPIYEATDRIAYTFQTTVTGALIGVVTGGLVGLTSRKIRIEGDQALYDSFLDEFKFRIPTWEKQK